MSALQRLGIKPNPVRKARYSETQEQTSQAFGFQWAMRDVFDSEAMETMTRNWLFERYCDGDPARLAAWLEGSRKIILDAGCGAGLSGLVFFADLLKQHDYLGVDIAQDAVETAQQRFQERGYPATFLNASLTDLPVPDEAVDMIFSEGVLHHTDDTKASLHYLTKKLKRGGHFLFYVYAKKAVVREFTDDHIRTTLESMSDEEAWEALKPLSKLGKALGELNVEIDVPEDIPYLGIKKGKLDIQRFFYWNVCKLFHRPEYTLDEMNHVNFDWFRPLNCHRHTPEEVQGWCAEFGLDIVHFNVQEAGITVVAQKQ